MCLCAVYCDCGVSDFCNLVPLAGVCVCALVCAPHWNTLQHTLHIQQARKDVVLCGAGRCVKDHSWGRPYNETHYHTTITHCNKHTATLCSTLQHTAIHCNTLRQIETHCNTALQIGENSVRRGTVLWERGVQ